MFQKVFKLSSIGSSSASPESGTQAAQQLDRIEKALTACFHFDRANNCRHACVERALKACQRRLGNLRDRSERSERLLARVREDYAFGVGAPFESSVGTANQLGTVVGKDAANLVAGLRELSRLFLATASAVDAFCEAHDFSPAEEGEEVTPSEPSKVLFLQDKWALIVQEAHERKKPVKIEHNGSWLTAYPENDSLKKSLARAKRASDATSEHTKKFSEASSALKEIASDTQTTARCVEELEATERACSANKYSYKKFRGACQEAHNAWSNVRGKTIEPDYLAFAVRQLRCAEDATDFLKNYVRNRSPEAVTQEIGKLLDARDNPVATALWMDLGAQLLYGELTEK